MTQATGDGCRPGRRCPDCGGLLIHQSKRHADESASVIGQAVHDLLPTLFTWNDLDGVLYRRSKRLLRLFEHKSPLQRRGDAQREALRLLTRLVEHAKTCPGLRQEVALHPESGVYLIEGDPSGSLDLGSHTVTKLGVVPAQDGEPVRYPDEESLLVWLPLLDGALRQWVQDRRAMLRAAQATPPSVRSGATES